MIRHAKSSAVLSDGFRIAYQRWSQAESSSSRKCLCLHGWLDNSSSFSILGPYLAERGFDVVAIDHQGHGHSSHSSHNQLQQFPKYVFHVKEVLKQLHWDKAMLIGHSMGGGISTLFAGAYPDVVEKLVLIEGFGPITKDPSTSAASLRKALDAESKFHAKVMSITGGPLYDSIFEAMKARVATVKRFPGNQYISEEAALTLIRRGTFSSSVVDVDDPAYLLDPSDSESVRFRHDPKLSLPSYSYFTPEQVLSYISGIESPTLYISAEDGFPYSQEEELLNRMKVLFDKNLLVHEHCEGSHHLHLDPDQAYKVAEHVAKFLSN